MKKFIKIIDKHKFMEKILKFKKSGLCISFEGKLQNYGLDRIDGSINEENSKLQRNVIEPKADFFIFDLDKTNADALMSVLNIEDLLEWDIFHIKIADSNGIVFESYDWFSDCYLNSDFYDLNFINNLISDGIIGLP